jgi:signal transduction histidine kinase
MDSAPLKILLVEDNPADADLIGEILDEADEIQWSLVHVEKLKEALTCLRENHFDVVLLDLSLPDKQGLGTVAQTYQAAPDLPIVVLTGLNDKVIALEALREGAQDYLVKGKIDSNLLVRAIRHAIERAHTLKRLRHSEEQLQRLNEELERRVEEQTDELRQKNQYLQCEIAERQRLEEELRNALAKEKELGEFKSNIISVVSHEYRTPLATILSSTELLENYSHQWPQEKKQRHFQRIQSSVHRLTQLVSDVLLISKAEVGKLEFNPSWLDLVAFCRELVEELQLTTKSEHSISFNAKVHVGKRIWMKNCCGNSSPICSQMQSSTHRRGGTIQFDLVCDRDRATFCIRDQGIGIPPEDQAQLFDAFHRSSNVGTISGTGLGLTIVKKCVDIHKGQIAVESEVGVGTTFTVTLPLSSQSAGELREMKGKPVDVSI